MLFGTATRYNMSLTFSIILPIYNQQEHLSFLFDTYRNALSKQNYTWEVLFVVNGSTDESFARAQELCESDTRFHAYNLDLGGWGRAIKFGCKIAKGEYICYTNSARTDVEDLLLILDYAMVNKTSIVKAHRIIRESYVRRFGSVLYNFQNRSFFKTPIWDVNGTPKVFPHKVLKNIEITCDNDLIDAEVIAKAFKAKHPIIEIPIISTDRLSGKSTTNFKSAYKMYFGLIKLRKQIK